MSKITYNYETGRMSHFSVKKEDSECDANPRLVPSVGVFCQDCEFYHGIYNGRYVICTHPESKNSGTSADTQHNKLYEEIRNRAIAHFYD